MNPQKPGIDGLVPFYTPPADACCPPDLCSITLDSLRCAYVGLLPSGPLWDAAKQRAMNLPDGGLCGDPCASDCPPANACSSMVDYARFTGAMLYNQIFDSLWPSLRESSPVTAYTTMDSWLDRLGWRDCYNTHCRDPRLGEMTPYEIMGECGVEYCPPTFTPAFSLIYKRGVLTALWRLRHGVAKNLAGINFVLAPLYSEIVLDPNFGPTNPDVEPCLVLRPTADEAPHVQPAPCPRNAETDAVDRRREPIFLTPATGLCAGSPPKVYPMTLAAHCIARSLLPTCCNVCLRREP